jgi:hypothetical protein
MAPDASHADVVLFGREGTWTWDGMTWTEQHPVRSPSARQWPGMAYDSFRHNVVLFGGTSGGYDLGDTWTWDGTNWTEQQPLTSPSARYDMGVTYDAKLGEVVLFGGASNGYALGDTWTWDGTYWHPESPRRSPSARSRCGMTYDAARDGVVLFGGDAFPRVFGDTWSWDGINWRVPLHEHLHLSPNSGTPGTVAHAKGSGFAAFERIIIRFVDSDTGKTRLLRVKTEASGAFDAHVTIPSDASVGTQLVTASGWRSGQHAKARFTVT